MHGAECPVDWERPSFSHSPWEQHAVGEKNAKSFPGDLNVWWHEASLLVLLQWKGKKEEWVGFGCCFFFFFFLFPKNKEDSEQAWSLLVFPLLHWPSDSKSRHTGKDPDARRSKAKEKREVDDELVRWQLVMDREAWHVVKNRTGLSDWTTICNLWLNLLFCPLNLQKLHFIPVTIWFYANYILFLGLTFTNYLS